MCPVTDFQRETQQVVHYALGGRVQKRRGNLRFTQTEDTVSVQTVMSNYNAATLDAIRNLYVVISYFPPSMSIHSLIISIV